MPAAWLAHDLHHEAWKRSTSTFLPMRERESKGSPPVMSGTRTAGAAGAAAPEAGASRRAARATAGPRRFTAHSIRPIDQGVVLCGCLNAMRLVVNESAAPLSSLDEGLLVMIVQVFLR